MGRRTRTLLPTSEKLLKPSADQVTTRKNLEAQKRVQSMQFNRGTKNLPPLLVGDAVRMKLPGEQKWGLGVCTRSLGRRSYEVEVEGRTYRRNRRQLRSTPEPLPRNGAEEVIPTPAQEESSLLPTPRQELEPEQSTSTGVHPENALPFPVPGEPEEMSETLPSFEPRRSGRVRRPPVWQEDYDLC